MSDAFDKRARQLGPIIEYEADGSGRVYAVYDNGEVLPVGVTLPSLSGLSHVPPAGFDEAIKQTRSVPVEKEKR